MSDDETQCCCDYVEHITVAGRPVEIHHVIPDDDSPHEEHVACPCAPLVQWLRPDLVVVDHLDQEEPCSGASTGAERAP